MISAQELEARLRTVDVLAGVNVGYPTEGHRIFQPWVVLISGYVHIHGDPKYYEAQFDLREIEGPSDVLHLMSGLVKAFEQCARSEEARIALN